MIGKVARLERKMLRSGKKGVLDWERWHDSDDDWRDTAEIGAIRREMAQFGRKWRVSLKVM